MAWTGPVQADNNVNYGGLGYIYTEERLNTGAALATPDTPHKLSKVGDIKITRKASTALTQIIKATSNSGEELIANRAFDPGVATNQAPDLTISTNFIESTQQHLDFFSFVRGRWWVSTFPLALYNNNGTFKKMELYAFGQWEDGGEITVNNAKSTEVPVVFIVRTNSVAVTSATNSDPNLGAATATIPQYAGYLYLAT